MRRWEERNTERMEKEALETPSQVLAMLQRELAYGSDKRLQKEFSETVEHLCCGRDEQAVKSANKTLERTDVRTSSYFLTESKEPPSQVERVMLKELWGAYGENGSNHELRGLLISSSRKTSREAHFLKEACEQPQLWGLVEKVFEQCAVDWRDVAAANFSEVASFLRVGLGKVWASQIECTWPFESDWRSVCGYLQDDKALCADIAREQLFKNLGAKRDTIVLTTEDREDGDHIANLLALEGLEKDIFLRHVASNAGLRVGEVLTMTKASLQNFGKENGSRE